VTKRKDANKPTPEELTEQELEQANGEPLPERHALTLIRGAEPLPLPIVPEDGGGMVGIDPPPDTT
jgi:hypothetical protein